MSLHVTHGTIDGTNVPLAIVRITVPKDLVINKETMEDARKQWSSSYRKFDKFVIAVDLTHESLTFLNCVWLVPHVVKILQKHREKSDKQIIVNGLVLSEGQEKLYDMVTALYVPTKTVVKAKTLNELLPMIKSECENMSSVPRDWSEARPSQT